MRDLHTDHLDVCFFHSADFGSTSTYFMADLAGSDAVWPVAVAVTPT